MMTRVFAAALAGVVAISVNTAMLKAAAPLGILAESGGLLRLFVSLLRGPAEALGITVLWTSVGLPPPASLIFWLAFHYATGFGMVCLYVLLEPRLPGRGLLKGSLFSLLPWLINGLIVLPALGQGVFGYRTLPLSGIAYFFVANWAFGAVLGEVYERLTISSRSRGVHVR